MEPPGSGCNGMNSQELEASATSLLRMLLSIFSDPYVYFFLCCESSVLFSPFVVSKDVSFPTKRQPGISGKIRDSCSLERSPRESCPRTSREGPQASSYEQQSSCKSKS